MSTTCSAWPGVVSVDWLRQRLSEEHPDLTILDCSWSSADIGNGHKRYVSKHIPGALFYDLDRCITSPRPTCARNMPDANALTAYMQSLGVSGTTHLVVYDRHNITAATKVWWTLKAFGHERVSVLDGGLMEWVDRNYELASGDETATQAGDFQAKLITDLVTEYDQIVGVIKNGSSQIVDTRDRIHFEGQADEPSPLIVQGLQSMDMPAPSQMSRGHMRGAINIHKLAVLQDDSFCYRPKEELLQVFAKAGVDPASPLVTTCYMGHSASVINMAAYLCGNHNTSLYYGSWTEFGQLALPDLIETTPAEDEGD